MGLRLCDSPARMAPLDPATAYQAWRPMDPGYRRSIDSAGAVSAPLLAGFSFTLLALSLPSLDSRTTTTNATTHAVSEVSRLDPFSGVPEVASILLLVAGVLMIGAVQAAVMMRRYSVTPSEMAEWYPQYFHEGDAAPAIPPPGFWTDEDNWRYRRIGPHWYGARMRRQLHLMLLRARRWANFARHLYNAGVVVLLAGITAMVWPPRDAWTTGRTTLVVFAGFAVLLELVWIVFARRPG